MANKLRVSKSGSGAPTAITPDFLGQIYIDEDTGTRYEATALTEGSWVDKLSLKANLISPSFTTPNIGAATGTSLALEGTTLGILNLKNTTPTAYTRMLFDGTGTDFTQGVGNASAAIADLQNKFYIYDFTNSKTAFTIVPNTLTAKFYGSLEAINLSGTNTGDEVAASSAEINTGTDNNKYITAKGLNDSRLRKKQVSEASSATPTPTGGYEKSEYFLTALAEDAVIAAPSGTPVNGDHLFVRIKDDGTARALTWNAIYSGIVETLPTTTTISKTIYAGFIYNSASTKWELLAYKIEE